MARALARGECGGGYEDAILILSSVVSTFAAQFWPRMPDDVSKKHAVPDAKRFVECWVTYADPTLTSTMISVPLLAEDLHERADTQSLDALKSMRPELLRYFPDKFDGAVHTGETADSHEREIVAHCPDLALNTIRRWSYPAVFYREVRSGYVHKLSPTKRASRFPGGSSGAAVTYLNSVQRPFRRIHFEIEWLCVVVEALAARAYSDWDRNGSRCALRWWIDGA